MNNKFLLIIIIEILKDTHDDNQKISLLRKKLLTQSKHVLDRTFDSNSIRKYKQIQEYLQSKLFLYEQTRK